MRWALWRARAQHRTRTLSFLGVVARRRLDEAGIAPWAVVRALIGLLVWAALLVGVAVLIWQAVRHV